MRRGIEGWALPLVVAFVAAVHYLPHLPGPAPGQAWQAFPMLGERWWGAAQGDEVPYPVHVDDHIHMARQAAIDREGEVFPTEPYTGDPQAPDLFTVGGLRSETGFEVLGAQLHQLTGLSFPAIARFVPALWSGVLALSVWALLRPAPGALASAAFVAMLPTTLRFLGVGFWVPSAFALACIPAAILVATRGRGPARLAGMALLVTGTFVTHIVLGVVVLMASLLAAALQPGPRTDRLALAGATLLPLLWLLPSMYAEAKRVVLEPDVLPFQPSIFRTPGLLLLGLAAAGVFVAWWRRAPDHVPHRVAGLLAVVLATIMATSLQMDHKNEGTYVRLVHAFFLSLAIPAGLGVATLAGLAARALPRPRGQAVAGAALATLLVAAALAPPLAHHLREPFYRVFDAPSWAAATTLAHSGAGPEDRFLSHPWQAPILNALTGAKPWTVLYPGGPPVRGDDWRFYLDSGGASAAWLSERGIRYVIAPLPPAASFTDLGDGVYRLQ